MNGTVNCWRHLEFNFRWPNLVTSISLQNTSNVLTSDLTRERVVKCFVFVYIILFSQLEKEFRGRIHNFAHVRAITGVYFLCANHKQDPN